MITEQQVTLRIQTPEIENNWLYQQTVDENNRLFSKQVYLGIEAEPWAECTNAEKEAWEAEHAPQVEDIEPDEQPNDNDRTKKTTYT